MKRFQYYAYHVGIFPFVCKYNTEIFFKVDDSHESLNPG